jgi:hypothetical protein
MGNSGRAFGLALFLSPGTILRSSLGEQQGDTDGAWLRRYAAIQQDVLASGQVVPSHKIHQLNAYRRTSALEQEHISPNPIPFADVAPHAYFAESTGLVQCNTGGVLGKDASLQSPDAVKLRFLD